MKIEFLGAAKTVTGSSFIIRDADFTIMVDCGMFQGTTQIRERNYFHQNYVPKKIDALLLTHAHIDHSGLIPKLVKNGFYGNIYTTKATADLCSIMLPDSGHIQEMDAAFVNKKNLKLNRRQVEPLYNADDAIESLKNFVPVAYDEIIQVHPRVEVRFRNAGHILGSSFIEMWVDEGNSKTKIVFSGDIGPKEQAIICDPDVVEEADILLMESTYGDRLHKSKTDTFQEFTKIIQDAYNRKGNIIIPAFAIERTQEIIYTLSKLFKDGLIPSMPVYIDSPLAISATEIFKKNKDLFDEEMRKRILSGDSPLEFSTLHYTRSTDESKWLNTEAKGAIIISANGMCTAGRIKHHLKYNLFRPESSIVFVGYQAEGTLGRRLIEGAKQVRVYGTDVSVKAQIHTLGGFSAHADQEGLMAWVRNIKNPKLKVFVVHGEEASAQAFAEKLHSELGVTAHVPDWGESIDPATMKSEVASFTSMETGSGLDTEIEKLSQSLQILVDKYNRAKSTKKAGEMRKIQDDIHDARALIKMIIDEI
ncbi:MAG TPA: MBL fold metallo-hydrolase [Spirochaetota bacterium]|nr:MBL fold metallo-hydrolase [Spirochaetota bacterium]HPC39492.1 MBL fold metallo-hydrolase [Spirochaetota bacterium]HPL16288.1 MBL fold metallo-hydrolase [Spirochaetota bacterium]HQJ69130.1 MBL fold metallo-hydrolase [Spirochaetota bacterium]HRS75906.1 MBL fold metallo-hydrolase [Spirochaetota bacterium]